MAHPIPKEALDDRLAFVGTAGSGKTYNAGSCVERLLASKARAVIIDPLGVWWGLRLKADGESQSAFNVPIFGGLHGDLALTEHAGALIGETVAGMAESCIIDLSQIGTKAGERRFMLAFLTALYRGTSDTQLHLVLDEADMWAPQRILDKEGEAMKLLGMMETVVRRGRIKGFIPWMITQRPAVLSKNVLSQVDGLVAFKLTSVQDRDAIGDWVEGQADKGQWRELWGNMATLPRGEGLVWIPARSILKTAQFPAKETFDSSRTPKRGEKKHDATLRPLDLGRLKDRLSKVEAETKANDPKALKAEIARLKGDLAGKAPAIDPQAVEEAYQNGLAEGLARGENRAKAALEAVQSRLSDALAVAAASIESLDSPMPAAPPRRQVTAPPARAAAPLAARPQREADATELTTPQRRILAALGFWKSINHERPSRAQVAAVAGYAHTSGSFRNTISSLNVAGLIASPASGLLSLATGQYDHLDSAEARAKLHSILGGPERKIVDALMRSGAASREEVAARAGYEATSGSFRNTLSSLNVLNVVTKPSPGYVQLTDWAQELLA